MAQRKRKPKFETVPGQSAPVSEADPTREYVPGVGVSFAPYGTILSENTTEECLPVETYRRMAHDPEISANLWLLVNGVLADGVSLHAKDLPETDTRAALAQEIAEFHQRNLDGLPVPITFTLERLLKEAIQYGHKIAEQTFYLEETGVDAGKARHRSIKVKSREAVSFVVDQFWNLLGLHANQVYELGTPNIIPRSKFVVVSLREEDEDPRGNSWLRCAVNGWRFKAQAWPQWSQFLDRCGIPGLVGKTAQSGAGALDQVLRDSNGNVMLDGSGQPRKVTPQEAMTKSLVAFRSASVIAIPYGAEVDALEVESDGAIFSTAVEDANREMTRGILYSTRATNEAEYGSRADSQTSAGILEGLIWYLKNRIARVILNDILRVVHLLNYPPDTLDLMPSVSLGDSDRHDWATDATAATSLYGKVAKSQWADILTSLKIKEPEEGEEIPYPDGPMMPGAGFGDGNEDDPKDKPGDKKPKPDPKEKKPGEDNQT